MLDPDRIVNNTSSIIGQAKAKSVFAQSLSSGKMAQSWIFVGPKGVGKSSFAHYVIRELLADSVSLDQSAPDVPSSPSESSMGLFGDLMPAAEAAPAQPEIPADLHHPDHPVYRKIHTKSHPDFLSIGIDPNSEKKKSELSVDEIREVSLFLRGTSSTGGWRVVLIDDAECMNKNAANALLKILEEPPPKSMIILIASTLGYFPPTIRSRCRVLPFQHLSDADVSQYLTANHPAVMESDRSIITTLASGSIGQLNMIIQSGGLELFHDVRKLLDRADDKTQFWPAAHNIAEKMEKQPDIAPVIFNKIIEKAIFGGAPGSAKPAANDGFQSLCTRLLRQKSVPQWLDYYSDMQQLVGKQQFLYLDAKQTWLGLLGRLAA